jgi:two-component system OmpR family response regulator
MSADLASARRQDPDEPLTILVVDDDPGILSEIETYISGHGYQVHTASSAVQMDGVLRTHDVQLLLLDIMMPGEDGLSVCRRLSGKDELQIILMSARGEDVDRIVGLELGADHYLPKPFNPRELLAQIRALSRRRDLALKAGERTGERQFRGWRLQPARHRLLAPSGAQVALTQGEFKMLMAFVDHPEIALGRAFLREAVELDETDRTSRVVDTMVSRLRAKLGQESGRPGYIQTIRNDGYVFTAPVTRH